MRLPLALLPLTACAQAPPPAAAEVDPELAARLADVLERERARLGFVGATLAVTVPGQPTWTGASGLADRDVGRPLDARAPFRVGSITKTVHAAATLRLASDGVIDLDAPVAPWLPWLPRGDRITPRLLLSHRTGIVDYTDQAAFVSRLEEPWSPREIIDACLADGPLFEVDAEHRYSNTNYYVNALLLEAVTGEPFHDLLRGVVLEPVGMADTWLEGPEARDGLVQGYLNGVATPPFDPSWHWAAGGLVSHVGDLTTWAEALLGEGFLTDQEQAAMATRAPGPDGPVPYGLGLRFRPTDTACGEVVGHTGSTMGFQSDLYRSEQGIVIAALGNDFLYEVSELADAACAAAADWLSSR